MSFDTFYMQILCVGLLVLAAHYGGRITRRLHVGEVVGQVIGGLVVGPVLLFFVGHRFPAYREALHSLHFLTFIFLSLIAFGIGDELRVQKLKGVGRDVVIMSLIEATVTWVCVTGAFFALGFKPIVALVIGSIGIATAPAATFAIMNKLEITGKMRGMLGGLVVLDDVIEVIIFSIVCQIALLLQNGAGVSVNEVAFHVGKELGFAVLIGAAIFLVLRLAVERRWLLPKEQRAGAGTVPGPEFLSRLISEMPGPSVNVFIIVSGCVCLGVGFALHHRLPFLITAITAGILISNFYSREVFQSLRIESATSIYTLFFFALIGANADLESFHPENFIPIIVYVGARTLGKVGGTWLGCKATGQEDRMRKTMPKLMLPQAGVAAVEAFYVAAVLGQDGQQVLGVILPGLIVFEIAGVLTSERALIKWRSWVTGGGELIGTEDAIRDKLASQKLTVAKILHPDSLLVPFDVSTKGEATWELIRTLHTQGFFDNPGQVLEIILERERQGGTTLGDGIAILHGRLPDIERPAVAMGILPRGHAIPCGGPDDVPVDIIYLVVSPVQPPEAHLAVLSAIAKLLQDRDARTRLRYAQTVDEAMKIIREHSQSGQAQVG